MVITGASSGIGLVTARLAARQGAKLVLAARNEDALRQISDDLEGHGAQCLAVVADVANTTDMRRLAQSAIDRFGGFGAALAMVLGTVTTRTRPRRASPRHAAESPAVEEASIGPLY